MITKTLQFARGFMALTLLMGLALCPVTNAEDAGITGKWNIVVDMAGEEITASMTVTQNDDGTYAGMLSSPMGDAEFDSVEFSGTDLKFTQTFGEGPDALVFDFVGKLEGDSFFGILNSDMGEMSVKGARAVASQIFGTWSLEASSELGDMEFSLVLNADLTGNLSGAALANVSVASDSLSFNITLPIEGDSMDFEVELTLNNGELSGDAYLNGDSVGDISGVYESGDTTSDAAGHFGTWTLESSSELGDQSHTFILNADLTGSVDGVDVEDLTITEDGMSYSLGFSADGQSMDLEIELTVEGNTASGEAYMNGDTIADITGNKA